MAYDNTNTGVIGKNDRKAQDTHPDITGKINVEGVDYFLDGWMKERKDGSGKFYSLRVKRMEKQSGDRDPQRDRGGYDTSKSPQKPLDDFDPDSEIPF